MIEPSEDREAFVAWAKDLQQSYRAKRRRWAWSIHRPYSQDQGKPLPGESELETDEELG